MSVSNRFFLLKFPKVHAGPQVSIQTQESRRNLPQPCRGSVGDAFPLSPGKALGYRAPWQGLGHRDQLRQFRSQASAAHILRMATLVLGYYLEVDNTFQVRSCWVFCSTWLIPNILKFQRPCNLCFDFFAVSKTEPGALNILPKCSTTELHPRPHNHSTAAPAQAATWWKMGRAVLQRILFTKIGGHQNLAHRLGYICQPPLRVQNLP